MIALLSLAALAEPTCATPEATAAFEAGFLAQQEMRTSDALEHYGRCIELDASCVACQYEIGWSHWARSEWKECAAAWEQTLKLVPDHAVASKWLPRAKERLGSGAPSDLHVVIGTASEPSEASVELALVARFQNYQANPAHPADHHDEDVYSPKSARFAPDGSKVYVNSLEGFQTVVYDPRKLEKLRTVEHTFDEGDQALFHGESTVFGYVYNRAAPPSGPNSFRGKPVESEVSHGRWLWVPYYRRDWDAGGTSPSATAIVDLRTDEIVRVMPTGPIPKYVAASPDGKWVAIAHWGDNTLGVVDTSSGDPKTFRYLPERLVVETVLPQVGLAGTDRDSSCGFCLRGTVFTPDSRVLLVARMGGGGVAGFDVESWDYLGTIGGEDPTPRHLVVSPDGTWLYLTSNRAGTVSRVKLERVLEALRTADGKSVDIADWEAVEVGSGARTLDASPDGRYLFVAVNGRSEIAVIDAARWEVVSRVRTDSYTVGLAVSPDGGQVWTTSQGRGNHGGNSVCVYSVAYRGDE